MTYNVRRDLFIQSDKNKFAIVFSGGFNFMLYAIRNIDEVIRRILKFLPAFKLNTSITLENEEKFIDIFMDMPIEY